MSTTRNSLLLVQIDGIELMTELLQNEGWSHIPIIGKLVMPTY
jgi:CheY-like chemotaxis protein